MPISFSCGQCGKDYVVSDALSGKRAVCKACGNRMTIPGEAVTATAPVSATAPQAARSSPQPAPAHEPPVGDVYGFDEAPSALPPLMPRTGSPAAEEESAGPVLKKKKKKSSGSSFQFTGVGVGGIRGIVVLVVIGLGIIGRLGLGLTSRSDIQAFHQKLIQQRAELTTTLKSIKSAATAKAASPRVKQLLVEMTQHLKNNGKKKGRKEDIKQAVGQFQAKHASDMQVLTQEFTRIAVIPGALAALDIQTELEALDQVANDLGNAAAKDDLN
jgi:hypothetical protein